MYDYLREETEDVIEYIKENINLDEWEDRENLENQLYDDLWGEDSVTGNASGSYTFNTYKAEEYLCHNLDLLEEACEEFGQDMGEAVKHGAEHCDVTIRCYMLAQAVHDALEEVWEDK